MAIRRGGPAAVPFVQRPVTEDEERIRDESAALVERVNALMDQEPSLTLMGAIRRLTPEGEGA